MSRERHDGHTAAAALQPAARHWQSFDAARRGKKRLSVICITSRVPPPGYPYPHTRGRNPMAILIRAARRFFHRDGMRCSGTEFCAFGL
jgi:hypothetical protein